MRKRDYESSNKFGLKVGSIVSTNISGDAQILELRSPKDVVIKFLDTGNKRVCEAGCLFRGQVKDLIYGRGYQDVAPTKDPLTGKVHKAYDCWRRMLHRTHESWWEIHPTYEGTTLCEDWFSYDTFFEWYSENCPDSSWDLDKDLLSTDGLRYSPSTCCFLPEVVNKALVFKDVKACFKRGRYELYFRGKYVTSSKEVVILKNVYAECKNNYVRSLADNHPFTPAVRDALLRYTLTVEDGVVRRLA